MTRKNIRYAIFAVLACLIAYIIFDSTSQPTVNDLDGGFKEVATYRNENNTGPIVRMYAVTVRDTLWEEMQKYGDLMPYTKYGSTEVYFFRQGAPAPTSLSPGKTDFQNGYLAKYLKDPNGQVSFSKMP